MGSSFGKNSGFTILVNEGEVTEDVVLIEKLVAGGGCKGASLRTGEPRFRVELVRRMSHVQECTEAVVS